VTVKPEITERKQITLAGLSFFGDPFDTHAGWDEDNQIGLLWKRFLRLISGQTLPEGFIHPSVCYEVHLYSDETAEKGLFEVFVGMEFDASRLSGLPVDFLVKNLPATQYAVFTFKGEVIQSDWEKIIQDWLPSSGYESSGNFGFQYYDERFKGLDRMAESVLDFYVPIKKRPG
jgi:predicted transcriptional regulator YdeE